jgi:hypothetical protein
MMMAMESVDLGDGSGVSSQQQADDKVSVSLEHIQIEDPEERLIFGLLIRTQHSAAFVEN